MVRSMRERVGQGQGQDQDGGAAELCVLAWSATLVSLKTASSTGK